MRELSCSASRIGKIGAEGTARSPVVPAILDHSHQAVSRIRDIAIRGPNYAPSCRDEEAGVRAGLFESVEDEARMCRPAHSPSDDATGAGVEDGLLDSNTIYSIKYTDSGVNTSRFMACKCP